MTTDQQKDNVFTPEQIEQFAGIFNMLKKVHIRLINEGYIIKDGKILDKSNNLQHLDKELP